MSWILIACFLADAFFLRVSNGGKALLDLVLHLLNQRVTGIVLFEQLGALEFQVEEGGFQVSHKLRVVRNAHLGCDTRRYRSLLRLQGTKALLRVSNVGSCLLERNFEVAVLLKGHLFLEVRRGYSGTSIKAD